jgi:hypothetical protein
MGEKGNGSLEPGVASGEIFWIKYPEPGAISLDATEPRLVPMLNDKGPEDDMAVRLSHVPPRVRYVCLRGCGRGLEWIAFCGKRGTPRPCCDGQLVWVGVSMNVMLWKES